MDDLLRFEFLTPDDISAVRSLTRDVARAAALSPLEQTKLATAASELSRRTLAVAGGGEIAISLERPGDGRARLVVTVHDGGPGGPAGGPAPAAPDHPDTAAGLDLSAIRSLVPDVGAFRDSDGARVRLTLVLPADDSGLAEQVARLRPRLSAKTLERRNAELADALSRLESQSRELSAANGELERVNDKVAAVNRELALTNRGVLDLNAELERRADELAASAARHRQLAGQQASLADLGRQAMAGSDPEELAPAVTATLQKVLAVESCGIFRLDSDTGVLHVVSAAGCSAPCEQPVRLTGPQIERLRGGQPVVSDLTADPAGAGSFPLATPPGGRSAVAVTVAIPGEPCVVVASCDPRPGRFGESEIAFLEAAASLFAAAVTRTAMERAARHASLHDSLTGLPNRAQLLDRLGRAIDGGDAPPPDVPAEPAAVIFLDLDGFKGVNDTMGHAAGDLVLREAAVRLSNRVRPGDTLARLGGDEFVVLCQAAGEQAAAAVAGRLLAAFDAPFTVNGQEVFLGASAGIAVAASGVTAGQVLADADIAMYRAKRQSGATAVTFHPAMRGEAEEEGRLHNELRRARERGQLRAVYQPVVDFADGTVRAVEALLHWRHPELGDVPAGRTVAAAEHAGLGWDLTAWIAAEAAEAVAAWNVAHPAHVPLRLALNFTPLLLGDPTRIAQLEAVVTGCGLPFDLVDVELTETAFADPTAEVLQSIADLRRRGARLAIDDFGTGYSSLISLANLPFDVLKIDRSFVTPLDRGGDTVLVSAMTGIARGRRLATVGEGVETEDQLAGLIAAECDSGQGDLFAKPLERDDLTGLTALESGFAEIVRRVRTRASRTLPHTAGTAAGHRGARVLVVEDNPADLELLRVLLGSAGHEITAVADPVEFVAALQAVQPDLVLMDLRLRGTTGFDLVEEAGPLLTMPVVAVTGYPNWVVESDARSRLFTSVVPKPVEPGALLARVDCLLSTRDRGPEDLCRL